MNHLKPNAMKINFFALAPKALAVGVFFMITSTSAYSQSKSTATDTVCAGSQDVVYGILNSDPTSRYLWSLDPSSGGTIDNSLNLNDSTIQIDWSLNTGTYTLSVVEQTIDGCYGDTVDLDIIVNPLPTVAVVGDSVCMNDPSQMEVTLTGQSPWIIDYTDGTNNYTDTATGSPYIIMLPAYASTQTITVTQVTDGNGCDADNATLPSTTIYIYPKPATGGIFHY